MTQRARHIVFKEQERRIYNFHFNSERNDSSGVTIKISESRKYSKNG